MCIQLLARVDWDPEKAAAHLAKHKVRFADAVDVLEDEMALAMKDDNGPEVRFVTLGMDALGRILVVAYTSRENETRIITARKANSGERRQYESKR